MDTATKKTYNSSEQGLVAIIIVTIIIIMLSLMTIGFTRIMNRELRQSIDKELAAQANYAAEVGMNAARVYVIEAAKQGHDPSTNGECLTLDPLPIPITPNPFEEDGSISRSYTGNPQDHLVNYSCIIINSKPKNLEFELDKGESRVFKIVPNVPVNNLFFSWENKNFSPTPGTMTPYQLPQESSPSVTSDTTGILRTTVYPVPADINSAPDKNQALDNASRTYFLYPNSAGAGTLGNVPYNPASGQGFVNGNCNVNNRTNSVVPFTQAPKYFCNSRITGLVTAPPAGPTPATITRNGWPPTSCVETENDGIDYGCTREGNSVYSLQNYSSTYQLSGQPAGDYRLTLNYGNHINSAWPPPCSAYNFNINIRVNSAPPQISNWRLSPCEPTTATTTLSGLPANARITIEWNNNLWIPNGGNPFGYDPNFMINNFTLTQIVPPPAPPPASTAYYYVRITALYKSLKVSVQASSGTGLGTPQELKETQGSIDVTGQGNDVFKRLRGRVSLSETHSLPEFAVQSMGTVCKRLRLPKTGPSSFGTAAIEDAYCDSLYNGTLP